MAKSNVKRVVRNDNTATAEKPAGKNKPVKNAKPTVKKAATVETVSTARKVTGLDMHSWRQLHKTTPENAPIKILVNECPKRPGSEPAQRFIAGYLKPRAPKTIGEAIERGITRADLGWDQVHGFIEVGKPGKSK